MITNKADFDTATLSDLESIREALKREEAAKHPNWAAIASMTRWILGFTFFKNNRMV
jgi:hypothetical protein